MLDFELSTTRENETVKTRLLKFNGKEYDLTDKPALWYGASGVILTIFFTVVSGLLFIGAKAVAYLNSTGFVDNLVGIGIQIFQLVMLLFLSVIILGVVKYLITGNPEPFISIDIKNSSETEDAD